MLGGTEVIAVAVLIALLFGADTLIRLAKQAGRAKREVDRVAEELEGVLR